MTRVAVYTIAKNEEQHVARYMSAIRPELRDGDGVYILDTGSSDLTVDLLRGRGAVVQQQVLDPFRFDRARNANMAMIPEDYDVCLRCDLDEILQPDWRKAIDECWKPGVTRAYSHYTWNHHPDGRPDKVFVTDSFLHSRHGYAWVYPCHETLTWIGEGAENKVGSNLRIEHWADPKKNPTRHTLYLDLLRVASSESPEDQRCSLYFGRECVCRGRWDEGEAELKRYLSLPTATWTTERSYAMRLISQVYKSRGNLPEAHRWLLRACAENPGERETWLDLSQHYYDTGNWHGCYSAAKQGLGIAVRPTHYLTEDVCWHEKLWDLMAIGAYNIHAPFQALWAAIQAEWNNPNDPRLKTNLQWCQRAMGDRYSTHQRMLAAALVQYPVGPVLEAGCGHYSTRLLHSLCEAQGRELYTLEADAGWMEHFRYMASPRHHFQVADWDNLPDPGPEGWGIIFVDAEPTARPKLMEAMIDKTKVIVCHDAEDAVHGYRQVVEAMPYKVVDSSIEPWTAIISREPLDGFRY
jgi:tetratricopeptide (TPR) repeat protein